MVYPTLLPCVALYVFLCLDPSPPWDLFSVLAYSLICYLILSFDFGDGFLNYSLGATVGIFAVDGLYLLLLGKPLRNFKYIGNGNGNVNKAWWKKYFDVVCVPHSPRLIGWNKQTCNIPPAPQQSRRSFVLRSALRAASYAVRILAGRLYIGYNPAFSPATIGGQGYVTQFIDCFVFVGLFYWIVNGTYFTMAAGSVAIGLHEPRMWPDLFGSWGDSYTVRRFWGRTWHQMLRRFLAPLGKAISTTFGFRPGTLGSSYTQLYVGFFLSGVLHTGGDVVLLYHNPTTLRPFFSMSFYQLQAVGITIEDIFIGIATRLGIKSSTWTRVLGYVWVTAWFWWCLPVLIRDLIRAGGGIWESGADKSAMDSNLVKVMLGLLGFDIGAFLESWFSKV